MDNTFLSISYGVCVLNLFSKAQLNNLLYLFPNLQIYLHSALVHTKIIHQSVKTEQYC